MTPHSGKALSLFCGTSALAAMVGTWCVRYGRCSHLDSPKVALLLLLGIFISVFGIAGSWVLARWNRPAAWALAVLNALALAFAGFVLQGVF